MIVEIIDFESLFTGLAVTIFVCVFSLCLFYLFKTGNSNIGFEGSSFCRNTLFKGAKQMGMKRKKKQKKPRRKDSCEDIGNLSNTSLESSTKIVEAVHTQQNLTNIAEPYSFESPDLSFKINSEILFTHKDGLSPQLFVQDNVESVLTLNRTGSNSKFNIEDSNSFISNDLQLSELGDIPTSIQKNSLNANIAHNVTSFKKKKIKRRLRNSYGKAKSQTNMLSTLSSLSKGDSATKLASSDKLIGNLSVFTELQTKVKQLEKSFKQCKCEHEASRQELAKCKSESLRLHAREDGLTQSVTQLGSELTELQNQHNEVLKERERLEIRIKTLDSHCYSLSCQLKATTADCTAEKDIADRQVNELRGHLSTVTAKLSAILTSPLGCTPSPELLRAQDIATVYSNENSLLKVRMTRISTELQQMRQVNTLQQAELQAMRTSHDALLTSQVFLEDERNKIESSITELSICAANLEAQLQQCTSELDHAKNRNQEYISALTSLQTERSHLLEQQHQQSEVMTNLNYQFKELNAEKQRLSEAMLSAQAAFERRTEELHSLVASLSSELAQSRGNSHLRRVDSLTLRQEVSQSSEEDQRPVESWSRDEATVSSTWPRADASSEADGQLPTSHCPEERLDYSAGNRTRLEADYATARHDLKESRQQQALLQHDLLGDLDDAISWNNEEWIITPSNRECNTFNHLSVLQDVSEPVFAHSTTTPE